MTTDPSQYFRGRTVQEQMTEVIGYVDTRAAEVATDAIAADVAQVHQDMLDADADASAAAASAAAAAGTLANAVKKTGESSQSIDGSISIQTDLNVGQDADVDGALNVDGDTVLNGNVSVGGTGAFVGAVTVPAPSANTDAANKKYVDDVDALKLNIADINTVAVGLSGNQNRINGNKLYTGLLGVVRTSDDITTTPASNQYRGFRFGDGNDAEVAGMNVGHYTNGMTDFYIILRNEANARVTLHMTMNSNGSGRLYIDPPDPAAADIQLATWGAYTP